MSFTEYIENGHEVELELEVEDGKQKFSVKAANVKDSAMNLIALDSSLQVTSIQKGTKAILWGKRNGLQYSLYVVIDDIHPDSTMAVKRILARNHLRVNAFLVFSYHEVPNETYLQKRSKYIQHMTSDQDGYLFTAMRSSGEELESHSNIPVELINEIHSIHRKLDFIIKIMGTPEKDNLFKKEPSEINISGSGVRFCSEELFKPGVYLDIKLLLPISSGVIVETVGQVVRCTKLSDNDMAAGHAQYDIAVKFSAINEDDREFIIRYVFKRQRELLRSEDEPSLS